MEKNNLVRYSIFLIMVFLLLPSKTFSFVPPFSPVLPLEKRFSVLSVEEEFTSSTSRRMIGNITLAVQSVDYLLKKSALEHIEAAKKEAIKLSESPNLPSKINLPMGHYKYDIGKKERDYYLPIWTDTGINQRVVKQNSAITMVEVKEAFIIHTTVNLNLKTVGLMLEQAKKEITAGEFDKARLSLDQIFADALVSEEQVSDPVLTVWSNLILAEEFIQKHEFKSARYTLEKAQKSLKTFKKEKVLKMSNPEVKDLQAEIDLLVETLKKENPKLMDRIIGKTREWSGKVKKWF
jgi:hypothetical protein